MSKSLFRLIQSLSTNEKLHFKRSTKTHAIKSNKNYIRIYNFYEELQDYNKLAIQQFFQNTTIDKFHSSEVNYLKNKILLSLFNYNLNKSNGNKTQKGIILIESLASKGFRKEALKKLKSIKSKAIKQEEFTWVIRLIEIEEKMLFKEGIIGYKKTLERLFYERKKFTEVIQNLNQYHILRQEIRELQFKIELQTDHEQVLSQIISNPLIKESILCKSNKAEEHYLYIQVLINYLKFDFKKSLEFSIRHVSFILKHENLFDNSKLTPSLSNYLFQAALTKNKFHFNKAEEAISSHLKKHNIPKEYALYIITTRNLEFGYYTKDLSITDEHLSNAKSLLAKYADNLEESQIQYLFMLIVRAFLVKQDLENAMYYSNLWFRRGILPYRKVQAHLFSILIHYQLNLLDLLVSEILILKKLRSKFKRDSQLIDAIYSFIYNQIRNNKDEKKHLNKLIKDTKLISQQKNGYFDFISFNYHQWSKAIKLKSLN